jgi:hypothetical protein
VGAALESAFTFLFKYPPRLFGRGELVLAPVVPVWLVVLAAVIAIALVVFAYRGLRGVSQVDRVVLGTTRALALAVVLACLLRPTEVLSSAVPQRNVLAVVLDDSRSMRIADVGGTSRTEAVQRVFADSSALLRRLASRYAIRTFRFAAEPSPTASASALRGGGGRTDLAAALDGVRSDLAGLPVAGDSAVQVGGLMRSAEHT